MAGRDQYRRPETARCFLFFEEPILRYTAKLEGGCEILGSAVFARILRPGGVYTRVRNEGRGRRQGFSVQVHLMELAHATVNGAGESTPMATALAYAEAGAGRGPAEFVEMLELEMQDSANASV